MRDFAGLIPPLALRPHHREALWKHGRDDFSEKRCPIRLSHRAAARNPAPEEQLVEDARFERGVRARGEDRGEREADEYAAREHDRRTILYISAAGSLRGEEAKRRQIRPRQQTT